MKRLALVSVSNKEGLVDFCRGLLEFGFTFISTGGTARTLEGAGLPVTQVSEVTGFPEILDGRVKTLHPKVHGGVLARETPEHLAQAAAQGIELIDMVVVNLYPFRETVARPGVSLEEAIENIDIGGPGLVRAAAKNHERVTVVVSPERYGEVLRELKAKGEVSGETRFRLAAEAFAHTAGYDAAIASYLGALAGEGWPERFLLSGRLAQQMRYGENPHQRAALYREEDFQGVSLAAAEQLQGKELSFNNIVDLEAALGLAREFSAPAAVIIKHTNPCGVAVAAIQPSAYRRAFQADPVSAFGGIVGFNYPVEEDTARELLKTFLEAVIAPSYTPGALKVLSSKENLRLLAVGDLKRSWEVAYDLKKVAGGFLVQERDLGSAPQEEWRVVTAKTPSREQMEDLDFAFRVVKHVKSNAIVVAKKGVTLGVGAGQMNRVGSARLALEQAGEAARGAVLASDAFFPFRDTLDAAAGAGIAAVIQPGGSIKDEESIQAADEHGLAMVFSGRRHFKH